MTPQGFLPDAPNVQDILSRLGIGAATEAAQPVEEARATADDDLKRCYAQFAATPAGERILEDLLNQSLRRSCSHANPDAGIEQEALYSRERKGQNGMVVYIVRMIHDGMNLPAPGSRKKKKA
jgi:hypothetical protein